MEEKIKVQISFAGNADLSKVKSQLEDLKEENFEFYCCFLPRHIVEQKGFDTAIVDMLENILGDKLHWQLAKYKTFDEAMTYIGKERAIIADTVNRMYILDSKIAKGVTKEIELFTSRKVILL